MKHTTATPLRTWMFAALLGTSVGMPALAAPSNTKTQTALDSVEAAGLTFMREEEKLARDVYQYLYPLWNATLFDNISQSEQEHFEAVGELLDRYRLIDPAAPDVAGSFQDPELQALYDQLVASGSTSTLAALRVGALIEETDMVDLADAIEATDQADIIRVYGNLLRGSRNHLRSFVAAIEAMGIPYVAQVLTQAEVDAIVDSPMERGR